MTNPMISPVLTGRGLLKTYGSVSALAGADLSVGPGGSVAVMGPSGSGKTTLMHALSGIIAPDRGQVQLRLPDGEEVALSALNAERRARLRRAHIGFVFQEGLLLPELTAVENAAVPLMLAGVHRREAEAAAARWLHRLGLA